MFFSLTFPPSHTFSLPYNSITYLFKYISHLPIPLLPHLPHLQLASHISHSSYSSISWLTFIHFPQMHTVTVSVDMQPTALNLTANLTPRLLKPRKGSPRSRSSPQTLPAMHQTPRSTSMLTFTDQALVILPLLRSSVSPSWNLVSFCTGISSSNFVNVLVAHNSVVF